jgi:hypothetical protein
MDPIPGADKAAEQLLNTNAGNAVGTLMWCLALGLCAVASYGIWLTKNTIASKTIYKKGAQVLIAGQKKTHSRLARIMIEITKIKEAINQKQL